MSYDEEELRIFLDELGADSYFSVEMVEKDVMGSRWIRQGKCEGQAENFRMSKLSDKFVHSLNNQSGISRHKVCESKAIDCRGCIIKGKSRDFETLDREKVRHLKHLILPLKSSIHFVSDCTNFIQKGKNCDSMKILDLFIELQRNMEMILKTNLKSQKCSSLDGKNLLGLSAKTTSPPIENLSLLLLKAQHLLPIAFSSMVIGYRRNSRFRSYIRFTQPDRADIVQSVYSYLVQTEQACFLSGRHNSSLRSSPILDIFLMILSPFVFVNRFFAALKTSPVSFQPQEVGDEYGKDNAVLSNTLAGNILLKPLLEQIKYSMIIRSVDFNEMKNLDTFRNKNIGEELLQLHFMEKNAILAVEYGLSVYSFVGKSKNPRKVSNAAVIVFKYCLLIIESIVGQYKPQRWSSIDGKCVFFFIKNEISCKTRFSNVNGIFIRSSKNLRVCVTGGQKPIQKVAIALGKMSCCEFGILEENGKNKHIMKRRELRRKDSSNQVVAMCSPETSIARRRIVDRDLLTQEISLLR